MVSLMRRLLAPCTPPIPMLIAGANGRAKFGRATMVPATSFEETCASSCSSGAVPGISTGVSSSATGARGVPSRSCSSTRCSAAAASTSRWGGGCLALLVDTVVSSIDCGAIRGGGSSLSSAASLPMARRSGVKATAACRNKSVSLAPRREMKMSVAYLEAAVPRPPAPLPGTLSPRTQSAEIRSPPGKHITPRPLRKPSAHSPSYRVPSASTQTPSIAGRPARKPPSYRAPLAYRMDPRPSALPHRMDPTKRWPPSRIVVPRHSCGTPPFQLPDMTAPSDSIF
eukprot:scaffold119636_cov30-Tisochrysis_lutea.AAC.4